MGEKGVQLGSRALADEDSADRHVSAAALIGQKGSIEGAEPVEMALGHWAAVYPCRIGPRADAAEECRSLISVQAIILICSAPASPPWRRSL